MKFRFLLIVLILITSNIALLNAQNHQPIFNTNDVNQQPVISPNLYNTKFAALNVKEQMTLSPLFTPDNAIDLYAGWISKANTTIELQNQYITQWNDSVSWALDPSPLVRELVDAKNRGVTVRVQVREESDSDDVTNYLLGEGIQVRWMGNSGTDDGDGYLSATHNKMILIDDKISLISSINFGESAFATNREAGMVIQSATVTNYYKSIFDSDWSDGEIPPVAFHVTSVDQNLGPISAQSTYTSHTNIPKANFTGIYNVTAYANPDNADEVIFRYLSAAQQSIYVSMYTISRPDFNNTLIALKQANPAIDIQVLISNRRVGGSENIDTHAAAQSLVDNQIPVYNSTKDDDKVDNFYHNKYWIIDGKHTFIYSGNWSPKSTTPAELDNEYPSGDPNRDMGIAVHDATDIASFVKTEVWDQDVAVADAWPLGNGSSGIVQTSFQSADVVSNIVTLKAQLNGLNTSTASYRFGTTSFTPIAVSGNTFEVEFNTTTVPNGIATFEVKAEVNSTTYLDTVRVNVVNYAPSENWRLLITEVLPDPSVVSDSQGEFFEITNSFPFDVLIEGWQAGDDSNTIVFDDDTIIPSYTSWIIARNLAGFTTGYSKTADFQLGISLANSGDLVTLQNARDEIIDSVAYGDETALDGSETMVAPSAGQSIQRSPLHVDTNSNADFIFATPNPKDIVPAVALALTDPTTTSSSSTSSSTTSSTTTSSTSEPQTSATDTNTVNSGDTSSSDDTAAFPSFLLLIGSILILILPGRFKRGKT